MTSDNITQKVWSLCGVLYDDGVSYGDYLEQITYMIFLKMAEEYSKPPYDRDIEIPEGYTWSDLKSLTGIELENKYNDILKELGNGKGILKEIFNKATNRISDPAKLSKIIHMIDEENWSSMSTDVKGDIYEGLLQKNAEDIKSGAGQFFTPRPVIQAMVRCLNPEPMKTIVDPACGSGGFFLASYDYISKNYDLDRDEKKFLKEKTFRGWEIVPNTYRMCLMNLFLHNIGDIYSDEVPITRNDALLSDPGERFDYVLSNPPFGKKSSMTIVNEEGEFEREDMAYNRQDFWTTSSNKQLNFVQHINTLLKPTGKAAVVVPDNVLFEGRAGQKVREKLIETTDLHTILRLPTGIFYKPGVKANVIFFDKKPASPNKQTKDIWIYDLRTNEHFTLKKKLLQNRDLEEFIECYNPNNRHERKETYSEDNPNGRWRKFSIDEIGKRDKLSLDIFWIKDEALIDLESLPSPEELTAEIYESLENAIENFKELMGELGYSE